MIKRTLWLLTAALLATLLFYTSKFVMHYGSFAASHYGLREIGEEEAAELSLINLEELSSIPLFGRYFLQDKLKLLVREKKWSEVLRQGIASEGFLTPKQNQNLLIYRAVAQCATYQFNKCQKTIEEINYKVPHLYPNISSLDITNRHSRFNARRSPSSKQLNDFQL